MATEAHIPESVYLKQIGDNALSSEILEEKVTELVVGNKVKQVESSSEVAETVNTQVEAGIPTNESGTFSQALSVPIVTSNTTECFDAATTKDQGPEFVKTSESVEVRTDDITPSVEIMEKPENQGLLDGITTDACVSTETDAKGESIKNEEKNVENATEKEACEEKDESAVGLILSDIMAPSKQEALNTLAQNQNESYSATSSHDETCEDIKQKTPGSYATPVADIKEQDLNEFSKEEIEEKSADAPQEIQKRESVQKIEQEEKTDEIMPSVEIEEKMDAITNDASILTQSKSQVENTKCEEKDEEEVTQSDEGQKEKSDIPSIKNAPEEKISEKVEYESSGVKPNEKAIAIVNKDEHGDGEHEVNVVEKDRGEDVVTRAHDVSFEGNDREVVTGKESTEEDTKEIRSIVETTDVCILTKTKPEEETTKDDKKNEETFESGDGQTRKDGSHMVNEIYEDGISEMTESEEGLKPSNSFSITLNETEIVSKDEDHEKKQTESEAKNTNLEQVNEEVTESEDGQKENSDNLSIKEVCEETETEKVELEPVEFYDSSSIKLNEKDKTNLSNEEVQEKKLDQGENDVTLLDGTNTDVCVSTQAELKTETIENEDKNHEKAIEKEVCEKTVPEKAESEVGLQVYEGMVPIESEDFNVIGKEKGDIDVARSSQDTTCADTKETTPSQYAATVADLKEQDLNEFTKEEKEDKSTDAQQIGDNAMSSEILEEIMEKPENQGLLDGITTDACVSTETDAKGESIKNEETNVEKAIEKEACEEKDESAVGLILSDIMAPSKQEALNTLAQNQDEGYSATSSHDETCEDIKQKTPGSYPTLVADIKEQDLDKLAKEETEEKSADAPQQQESVQKTEQEEKTDEIMPSVEMEEKMDAITNDASILTQSKSQAENTKYEEKDEDDVIQSDESQKEKSDIPSIKNAPEEKISEKVEYESSGVKLNEKGIAIVNKDEDGDGEQEVNVVEKNQGEDVVTNAHDVSLEGNEREVVTGKESTEEDTKEIRCSVETTDVCILTETKPEEETTKDDEKNEETFESGDGQTKKDGSHMVKEIYEDAISEMTESEEGLKPSNSFSTALNETEIASKDEDHDMEQTESEAKNTKLEQVNEEVTESEDGQKENSDSFSIKEVCEETETENVESERVEFSDSSSIKLNEKEKTNLSNDEVQEKEQDQGEDDVTLHDGTNTDICVSTQEEIIKETIEIEDKNHEKAIEKEVEKAESEVGLQVSEGMVPIENEDLSLVEKEKDDIDVVRSSQDTTCADTEETTPSQYPATVADLKEQDLNEFAEQEKEDKSTDAQQASEECEDEGNDKIEQMPEESVKHEDQENEQGDNILEKDQGKDDFTSTQDVSVEGGFQEKYDHSQVIDREIVKERESTETQENNDEEAIESDDSQTKKSGIPMIKEICEETVLEKAESEEGLKLSKNTSIALNENEIVSKDEDQEKVQELYMVENDQSGGNDVISSQNAPNEDVKETTIGHVTTMADLEEEAENKALDAKEASEQHEDIANDNREHYPKDSLKDTETNEEKDVFISTQTESQEEATENEEKATEAEDDLNEKSGNLLIQEVCEETDIKKTKSEEEIEFSNISKTNLNEKETEIISKDENQEKEQELQTVVFKDEPEGKNYDGECNEDVIVQTGESIKGGNEDIRTSVETYEIVEQGSLHAITSDVSISAQKEFQEDTTQNVEKNEEPIESDDGRKEKQDIPSVKEVCEETSKEKVESEEQLELHDSPNMTMNEKTITFRDEDQEQEQEFNESGESQDKDNVTNSQDAASIVDEEYLHEKNHHNEGNEPEFVKVRELVDEDHHEIKSNVETKENSEQQGLSCIITTDVCSSTQTEPIEEIIEAIENDDDQTKKPEISLVEEVCQSTISERATSEDEIKHHDSVSTTLIENETENKEQKPEKEQELKILEVQGGEDDVISSQNASNEAVTIAERASSVAYFEKEQDVSTMTEEIIKSIDAQEASKQCDKEANNNREQMTEESFNIPINSCLESAEGSILEAEAYEENKKIEAKLSVENQADITEDRSEIKDETVSKMSSELEQPKEQNVEEFEACITKTIDEKTEDEITNKEDLSHDSTENTTEEQNGSFGETSTEKLTDLQEKTAVEPQEDIALSGTLGTSNSEKEKAKSEVLPVEDLKSVTDEQILEDLNVKEERVMSATEMHIDEEKGIVTECDEKKEQTTEIKQDTFGEVCEETNSEKAELEGLKLSDSSNVKINEKEITDLYAEDQEGQITDNVTSSNDTSFAKEDLQENNYKSEDNVHEFDETRESIDEDTKEIKPRVETKEDKSEIPLIMEVCEAASSEKAEPEDGVKHSESFKVKEVEDEIVSIEENIEKKQELTMSEVQSVGDDVISPDNVSNEDIKETTIGELATTEVNIEEGQDLSATTKEILAEEAAENKSVDAQEVSEPCENEATDKSEQNTEESVDKPVKSYIELVERNITEDDANAGNDKEIEAKLDEDIQAERTDDRSEVKDEVVFSEKMPSENGQPKEQNIEEIEACLTETVTEKTEDAITIEEEDSSHENIEDPNDNNTTEEKHPLEHEPANEQHGGLDEVLNENHTNLYETTATEPQDDITPSTSLETSTNDALVKAESANLTIEPESESQVQIPEVVSKSADVKAREECLTSETATKEILSDENPKAYGEREFTFESTTDEQINETIQQADKSYITTEETVSQSEQIGDNNSPYENRHMEQENQLDSTEECEEIVKDVSLTETISNPEVTEVRVDLHAAKDICESNVNNDSVDEAPKEEIIPSLEEAKTIKPEVNLSITEVTAYPSETREISADTEEQEVKEECIVLATAQHTDENRVEEEEKNITNENLSETEEENVEHISNEEKSDINTEEKALTEEESKLKHMTENDLEDVKRGMEEDQNEIMKNVILTDEVSEKDNCPTELNKFAEDLSCVPKASSTIIGEVKEDNIVKAASENEIESTDTPLNEQASVKLSKDIPCSSQEIVDEKVILVSQNLESSVPPEKLTSPMLVVPETINAKVEHNDISITDQNPKLTEEKFTETFLEDQTSIKERHIEKEEQANFCLENRGEKGGNEVVEDVIVTEVLIDNEAAKESDITFHGEKVPAGREASSVLTENLQEASPDMILVEHDPEIITATDKTEDKKAECLALENLGEHQVSTLTSEIDEGKQNVPDDMQNKEIEAVQSQESSEVDKLLSQNVNKNDDSLVLPSVEKDTKQGVDNRFEEAPDVVQHEKGLDHTTEVKSVDVASNAEYSDIEPPHLDTKEATSELISQENKKGDDNTKTLIPVEDVKSSTEVQSADLEIPSVMDPNNKKIEANEVEGVIKGDEHLESTCDRSKTIEEVSEFKQELDVPVTFATGATEDLKISHNDKTTDLTKIRETQLDEPSAACTEDTQATAKSLISEVEDLTVIKASSTEPQCNSEVLKEEEKTSDEKDKSPEATKVDSQVCDQNKIGAREVVLAKYEIVDKEEIADKENEDEEEEDNGKTGDATEASKDMEVKVVHKKSHNILSGVGSKVKHSIAKVKKAITGKSSSSHPKPASP